MPSRKSSSIIASILLYAACISALTNRISNCSSSTFQFPLIHGAEPVAIDAGEIHNFTAFSLSPGTSLGGVYTLSFCNVTVTYTHPGWNDQIHAQVWLPLDKWNGRLQALGGGGYSAGLGSVYLTQAVAQGYVAIETDAGHESGSAAATSPPTWALMGDGKVNLHLLQDFASRSLEELAIIGKAITENYYGTSPKFSYFNGCSGGGRQGFMIAQKYPSCYDGILASAPAINIESFIPAAYWAHQVMVTLGYYPPPCEIQAFTDAAVQECDGLDGIEDEIISRPRLCNFTAHSMIGQEISCNGSIRVFTKAGADIVQAAWTGPQNYRGKIGWNGLNKDALLSSTYIMTTCKSDNTDCHPTQSDLLAGWFRLFLATDRDFDPTTMTIDDFFRYLKLSQMEYHSILGSSDPDLANFRAAGGKMISWHGLADEIIPPEGSAAYYDDVLRMDPSVKDFYRHFEAPGVGHCFGGAGPIPNDAFRQLVAWVEDDVVPDVLIATGGEDKLRPLCPYPLVQSYIGGDPWSMTSFECTEQSWNRPSANGGVPFHSALQIPVQ